MGADGSSRRRGGRLLAPATYRDVDSDLDRRRINTSVRRADQRIRPGTTPLRREYWTLDWGRLAGVQRLAISDEGRARACRILADMARRYVPSERGINDGIPATGRGG